MRLSACISAVFQHLSVTRQPRRPQPHLDLMDPHDLDDPNPDIHSLFLAFNEMYFEGKLSAVEVRWSPKMTLCAGTCHFFGGRYCSVRLSEPLLKFRPRSDLINTLLHESIHAYLFITGGNTDRDGHGPAFLELADRINKKAGTNITVYHSFRDEVNLYRTHVWKCNGCEHILRRAMNRPPQPADRWWDDHQKRCGGTYFKISEPPPKDNKRKAADPPTRDSKRSRTDDTVEGTKKQLTIDHWFKKGESSNDQIPIVVLDDDDNGLKIGGKDAAESGSDKTFGADRVGATGSVGTGSKALEVINDDYGVNGNIVSHRSTQEHNGTFTGNGRSLGAKPQGILPNSGGRHRWDFCDSHVPSKIAGPEEEMNNRDNILASSEEATGGLLSVSDSGPFQCPVCLANGFDTIAAVNNHLDQCIHQ